MLFQIQYQERKVYRLFLCVAVPGGGGGGGTVIVCFSMGGGDAGWGGEGGGLTHCVAVSVSKDKVQLFSVYA